VNREQLTSGSEDRERRTWLHVLVILGAAGVIALIVAALNHRLEMPTLAVIAGAIIVGLIGILGFLLLVSIARGDIELDSLLTEKGAAGAPASLSRFQFLVFTFVVAMCLVVLTLESGEFPQLNEDILVLLGISGGSYVVAKSIQSGAARSAAPPSPRRDEEDDD
jgi:hypothetical protein